VGVSPGVCRRRAAYDARDVGREGRASAPVGPAFESPATTVVELRIAAVATQAAMVAEVGATDNDVTSSSANSASDRPDPSSEAKWRVVR
jgi:hypothetical protein